MNTTPYTPEGLRQFDHLPPEEALAAAWEVHGPRSEWHTFAQVRLQWSMPVVHRAIMRIIADVKERNND